MMGTPAKTKIPINTSVTSNNPVIEILKASLETTSTTVSHMITNSVIDAKKINTRPE
jgi:hypothetical protein